MVVVSDFPGHFGDFCCCFVSDAVVVSVGVVSDNVAGECLVDQGTGQVAEIAEVVFCHVEFSHNRGAAFDCEFSVFPDFFKHENEVVFEGGGAEELGELIAALNGEFFGGFHEGEDLVDSLGD